MASEESGDIAGQGREAIQTRRPTSVGWGPAELLARGAPATIAQQPLDVSVPFLRSRTRKRRMDTHLIGELDGSGDANSVSGSSSEESCGVRLKGLEELWILEGFGRGVTYTRSLWGAWWKLDMVRLRT